MALTLLLIGGAALAAATAFVITSRPYEAALAGQTTAVGLTDPAADTLAGGNQGPSSATRTDWQLTTVSALSDAEDLLDYLEARGYAERELVVLGNSTFAVRWR